MDLAVANRALLAQSGGDPRRVVFAAVSRVPAEEGYHVEEFEILFAPPDRWRVTFQSPPGRIRSTQVRNRDVWWLDPAPETVLGPPPAVFPFMDFFRGSHLLGEFERRDLGSAGNQGVVTVELRAGSAELPLGLTTPGADSAVISIKVDRDVIVAVDARVHASEAYHLRMLELDFDSQVDLVMLRAGLPGRT